MTKQLIGGLWDRWCIDDPPTADRVVPRQVGLLLFHVLSLIKVEYEKEEFQVGIDKIVRKGSEAMKESAKRLRLSR